MESPNGVIYDLRNSETNRLTNGRTDLFVQMRFRIKIRIIFNLILVIFLSLLLLSLLFIFLVLASLDISLDISPSSISTFLYPLDSCIH